jgi:hypothetical protein
MTEDTEKQDIAEFMQDQEFIMNARDLTQEIRNREDELYEAVAKECKEDFWYFARSLFIDGQFGKVLFEEAKVEYQIMTFMHMAPNLHAVRDGEMPDCRRYWIERTKKASKDADLAVIVSWLCAFPTRPFYGQIGAADKVQAGIVKDRISALLEHNRWLNKYVELVNNEIRSTVKRQDGRPLCKFDVLAADTSGGAHGGTPDLMIINELSHIAKFKFVEDLMNNADGVAQGMVIIATNAGVKNTKPWVWRTKYSNNPDWKLFILDRPAPWHSNKTVKDAKDRNSPGEFRRLWRGEWVLGRGDASTEEDIQWATSRIQAQEFMKRPGWEYMLGLDIGVHRDHAAVCVTGINIAERRIIVPNWKRWDPKEQPDKRVNLRQVRAWVWQLYRAFNCICLLYDPHQAELMSQDLEGKGAFCRPVPFTNQNLVAMASRFTETLSNRQLEIWDDEDQTVKMDFSKFDIVRKSYGERLEAVADESGHADVGTAIVITLPSAVDMLQGRRDFLNSDDEVAATDSDKPLTDEEFDDMPAEFKELIQGEADYQMEAMYDEYNEDEHTSPLIPRKRKKPENLPENSNLDDFFAA